MDEEINNFNWGMFALAIIAGLAICLTAGVAVLYITTGKLDVPEFGQAITPVATASGLEVALSWEPVKGASSYTIYRSQKEGAAGSIIAKNITATAYKDILGYEGTYYYSIKYISQDGKETGGMAQAKVQAKSGNTITKLGEIKITLNSGASHTARKDISAEIRATGATSCRLLQDGEAAGNYITGYSSQQFSLLGTDGEKIVTAECRNSESGATEVKSASAKIILDTTKPEIEITYSSLPYDADNFTVRFKPSDNMGGTVMCRGMQNGVELELGEYKSGVEAALVFKGIGSKLTNNASVACFDMAQNFIVSRGLIFTTPFKNTTDNVRISFKWLTSSTISRDVTVKVYVNNASECRLKNEDGTWSAWKNYSATVVPNEYKWRLSDKYGKKTVFAECRAKNGVQIGNASAAITYQSSGGGGWYPTDPTPQVPTGMSIGITELGTTQANGVFKMTLAATGAESCRTNVDSAGWEGYGPYVRVKYGQFDMEMIRHTVEYECVNANGTNRTSNSVTIRHLTTDTQMTEKSDVSSVFETGADMNYHFNDGFPIEDSAWQASGQANNRGAIFWQEIADPEGRYVKAYISSNSQFGTSEFESAGEWNGWEGIANIGGLKPEADYTVWLIAFKGREEAGASKPLKFKTGPDTTAPTATATAIVRENYATIIATATDVSGIGRIDIFAYQANMISNPGAQPVKSCTSTQGMPQTVCTYTGRHDAGTYIYYARATDTAANANEGESARMQFKVSTNIKIDDVSSTTDQ